MSVSSYNVFDYKPTRELKNILTKTKKIKKDATNLGEVFSGATSYRRLIESLDSLEASLKLHLEGLKDFEKGVLTIASTKLTKKQVLILKWLMEHYNGDLVYTSLIEMVSEALELPKSTVRWNLKGLREAGLILAGDRNTKGITVRVTELGSFIAKISDLEKA
ncbi:hypothetical protein KEJ47_00055 [Candidatus Bathyarchaeota archaeon]|nr:hypothetical protein [Candidatus Bathyarchaeota archaeon]